MVVSTSMLNYTISGLVNVITCVREKSTGVRKASSIFIIK